MPNLEARIREKLERFSALLKSRSPAAADELASHGAPLLGSEAHEQYFTRDEIAEHIDEIYAKPFVLSFAWKTIRPTSHPPSRVERGGRKARVYVSSPEPAANRMGQGLCLCATPRRSGGGSHRPRARAVPSRR